MSAPDEVPDLELIGIQMVDEGVCEDTFEHRRILREAKLRWRTVEADATGMPSGLIEIYRPVDVEEKQQRSWDRFRDILVDPRDPWSDYIPADEYPHDMVGIPYWLYRRVEKYQDDVARGLAEHRRALLPTRCVSIRKDGSRCWFWSFDKENEGRCRNHAPGKHFEHNQGHHIAARTRLMQSIPQMVDELEGLALNATSEQVRLKAITEMMDRGGLSAKTEIDITGSLVTGTADPSTVLRERLDTLAARLAEAEAAKAELEAPRDVVDAELVEDPPTEQEAS